MEAQNYKNHIRYYTAHHFVFYPVVILLFLISIACALCSEQNQALWIMLAVVWLMIGVLSYMMRQHYALFNQNRTVLLELRFRYYVLTNQRLEALEYKLSPSKLYALRFASDEELPGLVDRAINENLSADEIKRAIKNWRPDLIRV